MVKLQLNLSKEQNRKVSVLKGQWELTTKAETILMIIDKYKEPMFSK